MSAGSLQWSATAVVTTHDWGVLVHDEGGAHQLKGTGLGAPVDWLRSRLGTPVPEEQLLAPLPPAARDRMRRLLEALTTRGAVVAAPGAPVPSGAARVRLTHGGDPASAALAGRLGERLRAAGAACTVGAGTAPGCVDGTVHHGTSTGTETGLRVVVTGEQLWLGLFPGAGSSRGTGAAELLRHLQRAGVASDPDPDDRSWEAWVPWLSRTLLTAAGSDRCVRLGWDPYRMDEHRLVHERPGPAGGRVPAPAAPDRPEEDLADPLVLSRRCAPLVDDVTSPLGVPTESGLRQLPLQLSACRVRLDDGSLRTVTGHGWSLEEARGRAVGEAVLEHALSRLPPEVTAHRFRDAAPSAPGEPVRVARGDVERRLAEGRAAAALGATAAGSVRAAAVRLAAHLVLQHGWGPWRTAALPPATPGADLLALHQDGDELLVATGLPFALVALPVAPGTVVAGVSAHDDREAVRNAVVQALLHHQGQDPGNEGAAPRTWAAPVPGPGPHSRAAADLDAVLGEHGTPVVVPLCGGPDLDAALPHRSLVLLVPGGA